MHKIFGYGDQFDRVVCRAIARNNPRTERYWPAFFFHHTQKMSLKFTKSSDGVLIRRLRDKNSEFGAVMARVRKRQQRYDDGREIVALR